MYFEFLQELLFVCQAASNTRYSVSSVGLTKLSCALSLPLSMKYSLCLIRKRFFSTEIDEGSIPQLYKQQGGYVRP